MQTKAKKLNILNPATLINRFTIEASRYIFYILIIGYIKTRPTEN